MSNTAHISVHLTGGARIRVYRGDEEGGNHASVTLSPAILENGSTVSLVFPHELGDDGVTLLRNLASELNALADHREVRALGLEPMGPRA